jgi:tetratricopeptide (TPR) repeat protein
MALCVATLFIYAQVRDHEYLNYDDDLYVVENPDLALGLSSEGLAWAFAAEDDGDGLHIPLTWLSYLLDAELWGLSPAAVLLANAAYHTLAGLLLFFALAWATGAPGRSAFVAAVFALHPIHAESVAWASERKDVVCALFWNATLLLWVAYARRPTPLRYLGVVASFVLALLAKPMAVTLPAVLLLLDYWPLSRLGAGGARIEATALRRALLEKLPLAGLAAVATWVAYRAQQADGAMRSLEVVPLVNRAANASISYVAYLGNAFWPSDLRIFYTFREDLGPGALAAALLLGLTAAALWTARRAPYLTVGWLWYLGTLVPVIGLVQVGHQAMADRYAYLPLVGIGIAVAWGAHALALDSGARIVRSALVMVALGACVAMVAAARVEVAKWRDGVTLFEHALRADPSDRTVRGNLGIARLRRGDAEAGVADLATAFGVRAEGAESKRRVVGLLVQQAEGELRARRYPSAIVLVRAALAVTPDAPGLHARLGRTLHLQGRYEEAFAHLADAGMGDEAIADLHARAAEELRRRADPRASFHEHAAVAAADRAIASERSRGREGRAREIEARRRDWAADADATPAPPPAR